MEPESSTQRPYYAENIQFLDGVRAPLRAVRLLSAHDMYAACDAFLGQTQNYRPERWLGSKSSRDDLVRLFVWNFGAEWLPHGEWKGSVQRALNSVRLQLKSNRRHEFDEWDDWESLQSDIHISLQATRKTVEFFCAGDPRFLPMPTDLFLVPDHFGKFLCSLVAGTVSPAWIATVDSEMTPGCRNGLYPIYAEREI